MSNEDKIHIIDEIVTDLWSRGCRVKVTFIDRDKVDVTGMTYEHMERATKVLTGHGFRVRKGKVGRI